MNTGDIKLRTKQAKKVLVTEKLIEGKTTMRLPLLFYPLVFVCDNVIPLIPFSVIIFQQR